MKDFLVKLTQEEENRLQRVMIKLYNRAYNRGRYDGIDREGYYINPLDMESENADMVGEMLKEL